MAAQTIPILPSRDFDAASSFYSRLGFRESSRYPDYLIMRRDDGIELHFFMHTASDPATNDHGCYVRFDTSAEVQAIHDGWRDAVPAGTRLGAPSRRPWGMFEFHLVDVEGNLVRLGARVG